MNFRWLRQTISIGDKMHSKCIGESRIVFRKEGCSLLSPHPPPPLLNNERILLQENKTPYISFKKINILWMYMAEHSVILLLKSQYYSRSFHLRFSGNSVSILKKKITLGVSNDFDIPDKRIFDSEENMRMYKHM